MKVRKIMEKIKNSIAPSEDNKKLKKWQTKLENARLAYADTIKAINTNEKVYDGTREVQGNPNSMVTPNKLACNVRNISYELVESQVDSSIPMPKVTPIHEEDEEIAKTIEKALVNMIKVRRLNIINDQMERTVPIQGGDFFHIEWDNSLGYHANLGDVSISERHPRQVIPQPGVTDIEKMDYIFIQISQTKDFVEKKYGIDVSDAEEEYKDIRNAEGSTTQTDLVTVNMAYYRNGKGGIGLFTWVDDFVLVDMEDYQARKVKKCKKCGTVTDKNKCPECGGKVEETEDKFFTIKTPILEPETGVPTGIKEEKVEYYKPDVIPVILRKNVSKQGSFLGYSDVAVIRDQQDMINKLGSKASEKLLKGGSIAYMPQDLAIETTDEELKVVYLRDPSQVNMIGVMNMQVNVNQDLQMMGVEYDYAKSTLGITDSYQGKYDSSATSGTAKQYSINQAAGRLESKRVMKNDAFSKLYEMIFKFWLAYSDEPMPISGTGLNNAMEYAELDKNAFLKKDEAGEYYWNDEFIFEIDATSTLMANREAMWQQADQMLQSGAFGPVGQTDTALLYWTFKSKNNYPNAGEILRQIELRKQAEDQAMQQQQMIQEGVPNELPPM